MEKIISIGLKEVQAKILHHFYKKIPVKTLVISFDKKRRILSTREGFKKVKAVANNFNPPALWGEVHKNWRKYYKWIVKELGYKDKELTLLSTGVDMDNLSIKRKKFREFEVVCFVTAGISSNAMRAGEDRAKSYEKNGKFFKTGTINIILITNVSLTDSALTRAIITATEAKTKALQDLDIRSSYTPLKNQATGTGTDNVIIVSGFGSKINYTGGHSKAGEIIAKVVDSAVKDAIYKQNRIEIGRGLEERLKERGIKIDELVKTGLEMYIPHPQIGSIKKVSRLLKEEIANALKDINIASLILAGLRLEEEGEKGTIPGLTKMKYRKDPVHLIADEILGIQIATYIGGTRALFEFERLDRKKPRILKKLPPFLDDVIGGLISGCLVKICS